MHGVMGDSGEKKLCFNGRPPAESNSGREVICLDHLRGERTGDRDEQTQRNPGQYMPCSMFFSLV